MFVLTLKDQQDDGAYAVQDKHGHKVLFLFEEEDDAEVENKSFAKSMLLTVPLFLKFAAVLMIKFVTDLIVFPLLFLYRLAGVGKRKLLKKLSADPGDKLEKVNGE